MFLHIGNGKSVRKKDIIGIFDLDTATITKTGKDFINRMQRQGDVEYNDDDLPRSFLLIEENKTPHSWKNPVWRHADGSIAEW